MTAWTSRDKCANWNEPSVSRLQLKGWEPEWPNPQTSDLSPPKLENTLKMCFRSCWKLRNFKILAICSHWIHIFYHIFRQFKQFPVLDFEIGHSGSRPFNYTSSLALRKTLEYELVDANGGIQKVRVEPATRSAVATWIELKFKVALYLYCWV